MRFAIWIALLKKCVPVFISYDMHEIYCVGLSLEKHLEKGLSVMSHLVCPIWFHDTPPCYGVKKALTCAVIVSSTEQVSGEPLNLYTGEKFY